MDRLEMLAEFVRLEKVRRDLEAKLKVAKEQIADMQALIFTEVFEKGFSFQNITLDGMTVYLHRQLWAGAQSGRKEELVSALKEIGLVEMISESYNSQTLSAWVREQQKEGEYNDVNSLIESLPEVVRENIAVWEKFSLRSNKAS